MEIIFWLNCAKLCQTVPNCAKLCQSRDNIIILIIIFINQSNVQNYTKFTITCDPAKEIIPVRWSGVLKN